MKKFSSSYFRPHMIPWVPSILWHNSCKTQNPQKKYFWWFHSYCNSNFKTIKLNKNSLQSSVLNRRRFPAFTDWVVLWNCFLNDLSVNNTPIFNFYKKKIVWKFDVRSHVVQDLEDTTMDLGGCARGARPPPSPKFWVAKLFCNFY